MAYQFCYRRRVEFSETDMAGIMHFSNFFRFMESAECAFYRSLGLSIFHQDAGAGWPRVHVECDYAHPLRFEQEVDIHLLVKEKRRRSIAYLFKFVTQEAGETLIAARGSVVAVYVTRSPEGKLSSAPIPRDFDLQIESAPAEKIAQW